MSEVPTEPTDGAKVYAAMRWMSLILVLLFLAASSGCNPGTGAAAMAGDEDLYVLRAIVNSACASKSKQVVSDLPLVPFHELPSASRGRIARFGLSSDVSSPIEARWPRGHICATVQVVDDAVLNDVLSRETSIPPHWTVFRERFGDARKLLRVSLPAYSADRRTAVVYAEGTCPYSCGTGIFYKLRKAGSMWTIVGSEDVSNP